MTEPEVLAAVDLGSNSFHMVVARLSHGQLTVIDRLREMVRLASGLDDDNRLDAASRDRALTCLSRFGERIRDMHAERVRVVGTNTLRKARDTGDFRDAAEGLLGHPIEVISGIEEARLIYIGASHSLPAVAGSQICVDIGGGSTELMRGESIVPELLESLYLGCVGLSQEFFGNGKLTVRRFEKARLAARIEFEPVKMRFRSKPIARFVGTSGTIRAARNVLQGLHGAQAELTLAGLETVIERMIDAGRADALTLRGLSDERKPVFPGGIAILIEAMAALGADNMVVADGSLREGILYDLLGRLTDEDARTRTVRAMESRYSVDGAQADRVEQTAMQLLDQVAESWKLGGELPRLLLSWSARLHEIGLDIAHSHYHRHGAYLLEHADMPGFPREEKRMLALLVGAHRRIFNRKAFDALPRRSRRTGIRLALLLRLAVLLNRSRANGGASTFRLHADRQSLKLEIDSVWLDGNPLTLADLKTETRHLSGAGLDLEVVGPKD